MHFTRQLLWSELLNQKMLAILVLLGTALLVVPWLTIRHYMTLDRAAIEHERSAYLATHDLLTDLPNRIGLAICPAHGESLDILLKHADHAMYDAKGRGRNKVLVFATDPSRVDELG